MARFGGTQDFRSVRAQAVMTADLSEALDAVSLLAEALVQSLEGRSPTGLEAAALGAAEGLCLKHNRPAQIAFAPVVPKMAHS